MFCRRGSASSGAPNTRWRPRCVTASTRSSRTFAGSTPRLLKSGLHEATFYEELWAEIRAGRVWRGEVRNRRKDGTIFTEEQTITPVRSGGEAISHFIAIKQ